MSPLHTSLVNRFTEACRADERVVACFLGGSYARGTADAYSDLDIYLITTDAAHERFCAERQAFLERLGEPLFLEDFGLPDTVFFIYADGTEGELGIGKEGNFRHMHGGPISVLFDKNGILESVAFPERELEADLQTEKLRQLIYGFWHDLSHFITAMGRGQLWWAYGQLEALRGMCVKLARLEHNFSDPDVGEEPYFKIEKAVPVERLAGLEETFCPIEYRSMLEAGRTILEFFKTHARALAVSHDIVYPTELESILVGRFEKLR